MRFLVTIFILSFLTVTSLNAQVVVGGEIGVDSDCLDDQYAIQHPDECNSSALSKDFNQDCLEDLQYSIQHPEECNKYFQMPKNQNNPKSEKKSSTANSTTSNNSSFNPEDCDNLEYRLKDGNWDKCVEYAKSTNKSVKKYYDDQAGFIEE